MIWLFCAAGLWGHAEALPEAPCWDVFEPISFLFASRTIMGPHGINRAVQRLEFSDCKKGLGEHPHPCFLRLPLTSRWPVCDIRAVLLLLSFSFCSFTGVKIIGGYRELTGEDFGIYIKRVIAGGLAALDGNVLSECLSHFRKVIITPLPSLRPSTHTLTCLSVCSRSA